MSRYFSPNEPGLDKGRYSHLNDLLLNKLDKLRELYGKPINITSSYRAASHQLRQLSKNQELTASEKHAIVLLLEEEIHSTLWRVLSLWASKG